MKGFTALITFTGWSTTMHVQNVNPVLPICHCGTALVLVSSALLSSPSEFAIWIAYVAVFNSTATWAATLHPSQREESGCPDEFNLHRIRTGLTFIQMISFPKWVSWCFTPSQPVRLYQGDPSQSSCVRTKSCNRPWWPVVHVLVINTIASPFTSCGVYVPCIFSHARWELL